MATDEAPLILAVDHNPRNLELLVQFLMHDGYRIVPVTSLDELGRALSNEPRIAVALIDISGFGGGIWRHCERLHKRQVPYLVLTTSKEAAGIRQQGYSHGARYVLAKPMRKKELRLLLNGCCRADDEPDSAPTGP